MQDRYTGDIGDFAKYGLLRALTDNRKLGVAWYLYPDENHNTDGKHTDYLENPCKWRELDAGLYDRLKNLVASEKRSVKTIQQSNLLPNSIFAGERLCSSLTSHSERREWRHRWFQCVLKQLSDCKVVFADPDNGLYPDEEFRPGTRKHWKKMPLQEAITLSKGRAAIFYHHNTRFKGGHKAEIKHWMRLLPGCEYAFYWRRWSNRTFFVVNPDPTIKQKLKKFADRWKHTGDLICND